MSDDVVIRAEGLGKKYTIGHQAERRADATLRDSLVEGARNTWRKFSDMRRGRSPIAGETFEEFWALKDVGFEVRRGEVLGVIGRNGAGKSTLLKILSRITEPSEGRVSITGRVSSLLEVGTGFHPELSGRENIYLNGAILGMSRADIKRKFDEVVAFADVERFLDTPVKRYSSGMYVRLAFAVAAHLEPEILILDEVLAVGDAEFQKKCLGKMQDVAGRGRTVLFVSHNMVAVQSLCKRCIGLSQGRIVIDGPTSTSIAKYQKDIGKNNLEQMWGESNAPGNDIVRITRVALIAKTSSTGETILAMDTPFEIVFEYQVRRPAPILHVMFHLTNAQGVLVLTSAPKPATHGCGAYRSTCQFPGGLLNEGGYSLKLQVIENGLNLIYAFENILSFAVVDDRPRAGGWMGREPGVVQPLFPWNTLRISGGAA